MAAHGVSHSPRAALAGARVAAAMLCLGGCVEGDSEPFVEAVIAAREGYSAIEIAPASVVVALGESLQLSATASRDGGPDDPVSDLVRWSSADPALVSVSPTGLVTGRGDGSVDITASFAHLSAASRVTASSAPLQSISVEGEGTVDVCDNLQLTATGQFADGPRDVTRRVSWRSSAPASAEFRDRVARPGLLATFLADSVSVDASLDGIASDAFAVSIDATLQRIDVTPAAASLEVGASLQYAATGTYAGGAARAITGNVTWSSNRTDVASVSNLLGSQGRARGLSQGLATLSAGCDGITGSTTLSVTAARDLASIELENVANPLFLDVGDSRDLTAVAVFANGDREDVTEEAQWSVLARTGVAVSVSNVAGSKGRLTTNGTGSSLVEVSFDGLTLTIRVEVRQ